MGGEAGFLFCFGDHSSSPATPWTLLSPSPPPAIMGAEDAGKALDSRAGSKHDAKSKSRSRSRSPRREKKHKKDRRRDRRRSRSVDRRDRSRDRRRSRRSRSKEPRSKDKRRSRSKDKGRDEGKDSRKSPSRSRTPRGGRMYKDLSGREFRDQRSRQYPSRSRSFGKIRAKLEKKKGEENPSAAMMLQQMMAHGQNPMVNMMSPTGASMTGIGGMAPGLGLGFNTGTAPDEVATKVLVLKGAVRDEDLKDDDEYADLVEDMKLEAEKHGAVIKLEIPRPVEGQTVEGTGMIYVLFESEAFAAKAKGAMDGRKFGDEVVTCTYFDEAKFINGDR